MERLNDNEVKEVARMQRMIDSYEGFIRALSIEMISEKDIYVPMFTDTKHAKQMNCIWKWVKKHKNNPTKE